MWFIASQRRSTRGCLTALSPAAVCHGRYFDFEKLAEVASQVTRNLNKIIDVNYYPVETARRSNMRHRPIGMGVQVGHAAYRRNVESIFNIPP